MGITQGMGNRYAQPKSVHPVNTTYSTDHINNRRILLNLGCGPDASPGRWTDIDGSWNLKVQTAWWGRPFADMAARRSGFRWPAHIQWLDITKGIPYADGSVDAVYASHVLEHLYRQDALLLLTEIHRILRPGGVVRMVLPDLRSMARAYLADDGPDAAIRFNADLLMRDAKPPSGWLGRLKKCWADHHSHKFMYDEALLLRDLQAAAFAEATEKSFLDSRIPEIGDVERAGRILNGAGFVVEAIR